MYSSPFRHATREQAPFGVRLACFSHAASVQSEPGSNSSVEFVAPGHKDQVGIKWSLPGWTGDCSPAGRDESERFVGSRSAFLLLCLEHPCPCRTTRHANGCLGMTDSLASQGCSEAGCCDGQPLGSGCRIDCEIDPTPAHPRGDPDCSLVKVSLARRDGDTRDIDRCPSHERRGSLRTRRRLSRGQVDILRSAIRPATGVTATTAASIASAPSERSSREASRIVVPVVSTSSTRSTRSPARSVARQPGRIAKRRRVLARFDCPDRGGPPRWRSGRVIGKESERAMAAAISPTTSIPRCHLRSGAAGMGTTTRSARSTAPRARRCCFARRLPSASAASGSHPYFT
jgi:hypothetical protein